MNFKTMTDTGKHKLTCKKIPLHLLSVVHTWKLDYDKLSVKVRLMLIKILVFLRLQMSSTKPYKTNVSHQACPTKRA